MQIIGFSGLYHDSAAALVRDGRLIAAAQEERFTRLKHDANLPKNALDYCLTKMTGGGSPDAIVYYENPVLSLDRVIKNALEMAPLGADVWGRAARSMLDRKASVGTWAREYVDADEKVLYVDHHMSHAASAFYPSPFEEAAILVVDGVGEWATTTIAHGRGPEILPLREIRYPHSLGLLYSTFTQYCGLRVNSGEHKLMGLASYGQPRYKTKILDHLIDLKQDGSFCLDMRYFDYPSEDQMASPEFGALFDPDGSKSTPGDRLGFFEMDLAASIQAVIDDAMTRLAREALRLTGSKNLCLAGGVALNCVTNGRMLRTVNEMQDIWIQPAAGDAGGALGAALHASYHHFDLPRRTNAQDSQTGSFHGPQYGPDEIEAALTEAGLLHHHFSNRRTHDETVAQALANGLVIGRFDGPMEFGPRALGNRSIIADARSESAQSHINRKVKFRESWRPFAPAVLTEHAGEYFELEAESPYMLLVADVNHDLRRPVDWEAFRTGDGDMITFVNQPRSTLPAITHVDYSARVQTVDRARNPGFHDLISAFYRHTGCAAVVNTSFNVRGEPIVCTPIDAIRCFMNTGLDLLAIGDFLVWKNEQPEHTRETEGRVQHAAD